MRKVLANFIMVFLLISLLSAPASANGAEDMEAAETTATEDAYNAFDKLTRGVINFLVSPLEFFQAIGDAYSEHDIAVAFPMSLFWGTVKTVKRAAIGAFEIVTFPFPIPENYAPIIEEPAFLGKKVEKLKKAEEAKAEETEIEKTGAEEIEIEEEPDSDVESLFPPWDEL